ncbi:MAG: hypothetical protein ACRCT4_12910 [Silvania sp.]
MTNKVTIQTVLANTTQQSEGLWSIFSPKYKRVISNIIKLTNGKYRTTHDMLEHKSFMSSISSLLPLFKTPASVSPFKQAIMTVTAALILSPMMVAHAQDLSQAQEHFSHANRIAGSITLENIRDNVQSQGSTNGVNSVAQNMSNERNQAHNDLKSAQDAQTVADVQAEKAAKDAVARQAAKDAADSAQVMRENQAYSSNLKNMHTTQDHLDVGAPGITKESNPTGHPTGQISPMDPKGWTMQPAVTKESNPLGHPTGQQPTVGGYTQVQSAATHASTGVASNLTAQGAVQSNAVQTQSVTSTQVQSGTASNGTTPASISTAQAQPQTTGTVTQMQVNARQQRTSTPAESLSAQGAVQSNDVQTQSVTTAQVQSGTASNGTTPASISTAQAQPETIGTVTQTQVNVPQQVGSTTTADISAQGAVQSDAPQTSDISTVQIQSGAATSGTTPVSISTAQAQPETIGTVTQTQVNVPQQVGSTTTADISAQPDQQQPVQTAGVVTTLQNIAAAKPGTVTAVADIDASKVPASINSTINVSVTSMKPSQPVTATVNGVSMTTTAGELAKMQPLAQVSVPMSSVFVGVVRNGNNHDRNPSAGEHGTGNGANNAANSNSAHGLGGGNHIGGGSAESGSRSIGHW